jgi:hypothetical protein
VFTDFPDWHVPDDAAVIWRYLDFTKLVSMLESKSLFFPRGDRLGDDKFEGTLTKVNPIPAFPSTGNPEQDERIKQQLASLLPQRKRALEFIRQSIYISCWHENAHESAAMWKLYLKSNEGVAVRSTFARLKESLAGAAKSVSCNSVDYLDYNTDSIPSGNALYPFMCKRRSFAHEREVRFWHWDGEEFTGRLVKANDLSLPDIPFRAGVSMAVDLHKLIDSVYVAPASPAWFHSLVRDVLTRYGYDKHVIQSSLDDDPLS